MLKGAGVLHTRVSIVRYSERKVGYSVAAPGTEKGIGAACGASVLMTS
jgi:hypothetical protein